MESFTLIVAGIGLLFLLLCFTLLALLYVCGILQTVEVGAGSPPISEAVVAYKFAKGPYKYAGDLCNEVTRLAPKSKCIGIYYDNPNTVPQDMLRYAVGAILSEGGVKIEKEVQDQMLAEGFKLITLPSVTNCVKTSFPYINTLSILIAVWKVYPQVNRYIYEHKLCAYPMLELYESNFIHFMAPLAKQEEFYVQEAKDCNANEHYADQGNLDYSDDLQSFSDDSPSSSCSRSVSSFSYSSRQLLETFGEEDEDDCESHMDQSDIQDGEVTSSVDIRASEARTNLLEEEAIATDSTSIPETQNNSTLGEDNGSLHDSGISSGRTSAVPTEINVSSDTTPAEAVELSDTRNSSDNDCNDSSSSFEEISMTNIPASS